MIFDLEEMQKQVETIAAEQVVSTKEFDVQRKQRLKKIMELVESVSLEGISDTDLDDTMDAINDILYDANESFQGRLYAYEHRNKLGISFDAWQSSHC